MNKIKKIKKKKLKKLKQNKFKYQNRKIKIKKMIFIN